MRVFKFGGASVKDAQGILNLRQILQLYPNDDLVVVVSAMGKMTNAFENVVDAYWLKKDWQQPLQEIRQYHFKIVEGLIGYCSISLSKKINNLFAELEEKLADIPNADFDYTYDQIICYGELLSTIIVEDILTAAGEISFLADARELIRTDSTYRNAVVDWDVTAGLIQSKWAECTTTKGRSVVVSQGFIGHNSNGCATSLGREGSDYSAAIFAFCLNATDVTIWKDVPGMFNADPKDFPDARKIDQISYKEAIELAYYGASVIHPKTIKPLENKNIPLYIRSFLAPTDLGTSILKTTFSDTVVPSFILKANQVLISITPIDFSFITEDDLQQIFAFFATQKVHINLMQNSAINFSVCMDFIESKFEALIDKFSGNYQIRYNHPCQLVTIRHYNSEIVSKLSRGKKMLLDQRSRETARLVLAE